MVRVQALTLLAKLPRERHGRPFALAQHLIEQLVDNYTHLSLSAGFRNFPNSLSHREKHRSFCALFMLEEFMDEVIIFLLAQARSAV